MLTRSESRRVEPYDIWEAGEKEEKKVRKIARKPKQTILPHPGQSYNPDPEDHARLLKKIAKKELEYQKQQAAIHKALRLPGKVNANELREHERQELESGIEHLIGRERDDEGDETDSAYSDYNEKDFEVILKDKKVEERRKTKRQRMGQLRDRLERKAARLRKLRNIRLSRFDSIKRISKELDRKQKEAAAAGVGQSRGQRRLCKQRLGTKFEPSDPIYCLSSELPSNLRELSCPMKAVVRERLESFQSRLLVEPTSFQLKSRKYKRRHYERQSADERQR